jgi:outer membrane immunogenic protein
MRKIIVAAAFVAFSAAAFAADLPMKAPPLAPAYSWTGWYVGAHVGYGWTDSDVNVSWVDPGNLGNVGPTVAAGAMPIAFSPDRDGILGGVQLGYNWQLSPNWVIGIEADISATDWSGRHTINTAVAPFFALSSFASQDSDWLGTLRARLGYASGNWLFYGTGGLAVGHSSYAYGQTNVPAGGGVNFTGSDSSTDAGWAAGLGIEYGWSNWTARLEYLHFDLGDHAFSVALNGTPTAVFTPNFENKGDIVRFGINYRFSAR